jgi:hypothetical protein
MYADLLRCRFKLPVFQIHNIEVGNEILGSVIGFKNQDSMMDLFFCKKINVDCTVFHTNKIT